MRTDVFGRLDVVREHVRGRSKRSDELRHVWQRVPVTCLGGSTLCGGACTVTANDPQNCGSCGNVCAGAPQATAVCTAGNCGFACQAGYQNCNNVSADGCEVNLTQSPTNCGACGNVCPGVPNGTPGCTNSTCGIGTCNANFGDCDGNAANGCEADLLTDNNNCNACSMVTHTNWEDGYADTSHCPGGTPVAESFKAGTTYSCGVSGCSYSAYVSDNCPTATNYCFL
jgi:hypothetical protein